MKYLFEQRIYLKQKKMGEKYVGLTLKLSTKMENKIFWLMHYKGKSKTQMVYYAQFSFHNFTGWKKQG